MCILLISWFVTCKVRDTKHFTPTIFFKNQIQVNAAIAEFADKSDFVLITKDTDFRNSFLLKRTPRKLIRVCLGNISNKLLISIFEKNLELLVKNTSSKSCYIEINREGIMIIAAP